MGLEATATPLPDITDFLLAAGIGENDNVTLASSHPVSQTIAAADLGFDLSRSGSLLSASGTGNFSFLDYLQHAYSAQALGRFDGLATVNLWTNHLKWYVADEYGEQVVSPFAAITPVNLQRVNVFSTGPDLILRPSEASFIELRGLYSLSNYQTSPFDGDTASGLLAIGRQLSPLASLSLNLEVEGLRFTNTVVNRNYDRREAYARYQALGARTELDLELGAAQADDIGAWKTTPLARLVLARNLSPFSTVTLTGGQEYTDASGAFSQLTAGASGGIVVGPVFQTTANYLRDYGSANLRFDRLRTTFGLTGAWERDRYDRQSFYDVTRSDVELSLGRHITPALSAGISGSVDREQYLNQSFTDNFGTVGAGITYRAARHLELYAVYQHAFRSSSGGPGTGGLKYNADVVFLMIGYDQRPSAQGAAALSPISLP